jgi:hypothetical protein
MSDELNESLIQQPKPGDPDRAEDVLDEIQAVMQKRNCAIVVQKGGAYLCVATDGQLRAIAQFKLITPQGMEWRPYIWKPKPT